MGGHFVETRRAFLQGLGAAGVTLIVRSIGASAQGAPAGQHAWMGAPGKARYRIDGEAKVRGEKIFARDFRAADMPGWPREERHAIVLRAVHVDRRFLGLDLSCLEAVKAALHKVILAPNLAADHIEPAGFQQPPPGVANSILVAYGELPAYFGQPVAILIFDNFRAWRKAEKALQFNAAAVQYGEQEAVKPAPAPYSPATYLTYYSDAKAERFSQVKNGRGNPYAADPSPAGREARRWRSEIERTLADPKLRVFEGTYATQPLDPVFLEPEAGLAWFDRDAATLHLVIATQSAGPDIEVVQGQFGNNDIKTVVLNSCYPGGGFGGRDNSPFPGLLAIAAFYCDGPVRLAFNRFEQFQAGLKQLGSSITHRFAVDRGGRFRAGGSKVILSAGGNNNYSQWIAQLAGLSALGGYGIAQASVDAMAMPTSGIIAGSMRGFGGVQAVFAVEMAVEEIAQSLAIDPIALRRLNVLRTGDAHVTGTRPRQVMRLADICDLAADRALWRDREREKEQRKTGGKLYGVGFALANQSFGTGVDGVMAEVTLSRDGEISVRTDSVDMGNGSATSLALCTGAPLGRNATAMHMGDTAQLSEALGLDILPTRASNNWLNPRWTPILFGTSSSCRTAFHQVHAVEQAAQVLLRTGILAAARGLWGIDGPFAGPAPKSREIPQPRWEEGRLVSNGRRPLGIDELAAEIYRENLVSSVTAHAVFVDRWVRANFQVDGQVLHLDCDGLSTRLAKQAKWRQHDRRNVVAPAENAYLLGRNLFAPSGALVAVEIDRASGRVAVTEVETFADAGRVIQGDLVAGQADGAVAMGVGYALTENAPIGADGPVAGDWNLDRYQVPLAKDVPLGNMKLTLLGGDEPTAKGIAEAVLCPIPAAVANAVAHATGRRPRALPITPAWVRKALA